MSKHALAPPSAIVAHTWIIYRDSTAADSRKRRLELPGWRNRYDLPLLRGLVDYRTTVSRGDHRGKLIIEIRENACDLGAWISTPLILIRDTVDNDFIP